MPEQPNDLHPSPNCPCDVCALVRHTLRTFATESSQRWHLLQMTPERAMEHERFAYNVGPDTRLGWKPYTFRATRGAVSQWACYTEGELAGKLRMHGLEVTGWSEWKDGMRTAEIKQA